MQRNLVIVESPAKARTIEKYLGKRYRVTASMGHVRDLPKSELGIDVEEGFSPRYITIRGKGSVVQKLREEARKADRVLLATDPDREGEAISWHLAELLRIPAGEPCRVAFNEITKDAVNRAFEKPRPIDFSLVDAQQARRVLDRLVGYKLSPLLWRKIRRGLSAGRVQSVAVRIVCDREEEIQAFQSEEYWTLLARFRNEEDYFEARYHGAGGRKVRLTDEEQVRSVMAEVRGEVFTVTAVRRKERRRNPAAPFTTSSLQQEAARKLGFSVSRTMRIAQELYEGVTVKGAGSVGLVTYIRTDSTRVSSQATTEAGDFIRRRYGEDFLASAVRERRGSERIQDAHEAIRPTSMDYSPEEVKQSLGRDQHRLYKLIWERFLASRMAPAVMDTVAVDISTGRHMFRASGSTVKFPGFMVVYIEGRDEEDDQAEGGMLPHLEEGWSPRLQELEPSQHFTKPPPRYTEAMLVKDLEEQGIGRPSTYAPIVATIQERGYVTKEDKRFVPTELGKVVTNLLKEHFPDVVDVEFTASMEKSLDKVGDGEISWRKIVADFYDGFASTLIKADAAIGRVTIPVEETDEVCEECGNKMVIKNGRFGRFLSCSGYPECRHTRALTEKVPATCPKCGADIVERRSRKGRRFYGCSAYPACDFVSWAKPVGNCPRCSGVLVLKGRDDNQKRCATQGCGYVEEVMEEAPVTGS